MAAETRCFKNPFPTQAELAAWFAGMDLPSLPTFPKPFFGGVNTPQFSVEHWIRELQNSQMAIILLELWKKVCDFLSLDWVELLPFDLQGLGLKISDFITGNYEKIVAAIKKAIAAGNEFFIGLFGDSKVPDIEIWQWVQNMYVKMIKALYDAVMYYIQPIIDLIKDLFQVDIAFPSFPTLPTLDEIRAKLRLGNPMKFDGFPEFNFFSGGAFKWPSVQFEKDVTAVFMELLMKVIKPLVEWFESIAEWIGAISIPKPCVNSETGISV